jgi:hypothetical protein
MLADARLRPALLLALLVLFAPSAPAWGQDAPVYDLEVRAVFDPAREAVDVVLRVEQEEPLLTRLTLRFAEDWAANYSAWEADGELEVGEREVRWSVPGEGGALSYSLGLPHRRRSGTGFDAYMTDDWVLLASQAFCPLPNSSTRRGAVSRTTFLVEAPPGWSFYTPFGSEVEPGRFVIDWADNRLDRPKGWLIGGRGLQVREATIAGLTVVTVTPPGADLTAETILTFMELHLPHLLEVFPEHPERVLVVSAGDPMWHGGLSGVHSLFLHATQGLVQWDGTSTLLHELTHVFTRGRGSQDGDWFVEGVPEYYSLLVQLRAGSITDVEYQEHLDDMRRRSRDVQTIRVANSRRDVTRRAVIALSRLDARIQAETEGRLSLDDVVRRMGQLDEVSTASFQALCEDVSGLDLEQFFADEVP